MKTKKAIRMPLRRAPQRGRSAAAPLRARAATAEEVYEEEDYEEGEEPNMKFSHALIVVLVLHLVAVGGVFAFNWMKAKQIAESKAPKAAALASAPGEKPAPAPETTVATKPATIEGWQGKVHTVAAGDTLTRIAATYGTTIEAIEKENGITTYSMIRVGQGLKIPGGGKTSPPAKTETASAKPAAGSAAATKQAFLATKTASPTVKPTATVVKPAAAPIAAAPKPQTAEPTAKAAPAPATADSYVVASGDNPYTIAKKLHVSYNALLTLNDIKDPTKIHIGQKLKVPKQK